MHQTHLHNVRGSQPTPWVTCHNFMLKGRANPSKKLQSTSQALTARRICPNVTSGSSNGVITSSSSTSRLKAELLQTISRLNSTLTPDPDVTTTLLQLVSALAAINPNPVPETSPLMNGRWVLLYTSNAAGAADVGGASSSSPSMMMQGSALQALSDSLYKWFYSYAPILAGSATGKRGVVAIPVPGSGGKSSSVGSPADSNQSAAAAAAAQPALIRSRGNFQTFDLGAGTVSNEARFDVLGVNASIIVLGTAQVVTKGSGTVGKRLRAMFTQFSFTVDGKERLSLPLGVPNIFQGGALQGPVGYVDTCFLDQQLRISTGDKGSLFITIRDEESGGA